MSDRSALRVTTSTVLTVRVYDHTATLPAGIHSYVVGAVSPRLLRVVSG